jgi:HSP20 family protein
MAIIRWEPTREIQSIQQEMNRLFGSLFEAQGGNGESLTRRWIPAMDLTEEGDQYVLRVDLPGVEPKDVSVEVEDRVLTVAGERHTESEKKGDGYRRFERASGRFSRSLTLPEGVDPDAVQANFENGVLEIRIPRPEERKPRRIEVSSATSEPALEGTVSTS